MDSSSKSNNMCKSMEGNIVIRNINSNPSIEINKFIELRKANTTLDIASIFKEDYVI